MVLEALAAGAQLATSAIEIVDPGRWFRPTEVRLGLLGPAHGTWDGTGASFKLQLGTKVPYDRTRAPSVLVLMRGGPRGIADDAPTWSTRVRLGGRYLFYVPPGTYAVAALYIAAYVHPYTVPDLLAVGEVPMMDLVIGDCPTLPVLGGKPTGAHLAALLSRAPDTQKVFRVRPSTASSQTSHQLTSGVNQSGLLYQCRARVAGAPNNRCVRTNRGVAVCAQHRGTDAIDFETGDRIQAPFEPQTGLRTVSFSYPPRPSTASRALSTNAGRGLLERRTTGASGPIEVWRCVPSIEERTRSTLRLAIGSRHPLSLKAGP